MIAAVLRGGEQRKERLMQAGVCLAALAAVLSVQLPALRSGFIFNDDVRQHLYWMRQFQDRELFRGDLLTLYARGYQPWGFVFLYYLSSFFIDPLMLGKILAVVLFALSAVMVRGLVKTLSGGFAGLLAALIFIASPFYMNRMDGGLPRAFAFPLLILFARGLVDKDDTKAAFALIAQALFYPMLFLVEAATCALAGRRNKILLAAALAGCAVLGAQRFWSADPAIGVPVDLHRMEADPAYGPGGRFDELPLPPLVRSIIVSARRGTFPPREPWMPRGFNVFGAYVGAGLLLLAAGILLFEASLGRGALPPELACLFLTSVMMYAIAQRMMLSLFFPGRYIEFTIPLIALIACAGAFGRACARLGGIPARRAAQAGALILSLAACWGQAPRAWLMDARPLRGLAEYLETLPKDAVIAAPPGLASNIPTLARRKVFIQYELSHPIFDRYWETIKRRTVDFYDAYYAQDRRAVNAFCRLNGVDYMVVDRRDFAPAFLARGRFYFEPFNARIRAATAGRSRFALNEIALKERLFETDGLIVIKTGSRTR